VSRAFRLLVGAALSLVVLGFVAQGARFVYARYARPAESSVVALLGYLFGSRMPAPDERRPLSDEEIEACAQRRTVPSDYFSTIPETGGLDPLLRELFSQLLCSAGELPLAEPALGGARVRMVWQPALSMSEVVRFEHSAAGSRIEIIELANVRAFHRGPFEVSRRVERSLSDEEWARVANAVERSEFWESASFDPNDGGHTVMDGVQWLVEVSEPGRYHMIHRMSGKVLAGLPDHLHELARRIASTAR
jgi:hypothetical protein